MNELENKIDRLFQQFVKQQEGEPIYVSCCIKYMDDNNYCDVIIKLNNELDVQDDSIHYYCNGFASLKSLCWQGCEDFILTDVYEFLNEI